MNWHNVVTTTDLLEIRIRQITDRNNAMDDISESVRKARTISADDFLRKNAKLITSGIYEKGTLVLVWENVYCGTTEAFGCVHIG